MDLLDPLLLARWQFGLTTLYHFLFVPLTLGMALTVSIFQTAWFRTGKVKWLHLTRFFGKIFLINFAMGVVTGIVQEFQFGMNWSSYSRFVGDVFGAPLAFEGLMAFFFEATFIGLWIFGWDKLPKGLHLASIWIATIGAWFSAYFILAANAFMQNPVGYQMAQDGIRAEMVDFGTVLTNPVALAALPHTLFAAFMMTAGVIISVAAWQLARRQNVEMMRSALRYGLWGMLIAFAGVFLSGDQLSLVMVQTQPMKMAAAEALFNTACGADASFSLFTLGTPDGTSELFSIRVPYLLALLSTHSLDGCVEGINDLNALYTTEMFPQFADQVDGNFAPVHLDHLLGVPLDDRPRRGRRARPRSSVSGSPASGPRRSRRCGRGASRSGRGRHRSSRSSSAGSSPRWAASPGSSSASCSPRTASRRASRAGRCSSRSSASPPSTPCSRWSRSV